MRRREDWRRQYRQETIDALQLLLGQDDIICDSYLFQTFFSNNEIKEWVKLREEVARYILLLKGDRDASSSE